jgi:hypothetical protein
MNTQQHDPTGRTYKGIVFSKHALERMKQRRVTHEMIVNTIQRSDQKKLEEDGDTKFIRELNGRPLHVVSAYLPEEKTWLVKTVFVRGEDDPKPLWQQIVNFAVRFIGSLVMGSGSSSKGSRRRGRR